MEFLKRPTIAKIHLDHLKFNAKQILSKLPATQEMMAIVKANAYGHGAVMVARTLESCGIKKFGVATFDEGAELRTQGIRGEIFVLNGLLAPVSDYIGNRLNPVIFEMEQLKEAASYAAGQNRDLLICLKFDTGMGRLGFAPAQVDEVMGVLNKTTQLKVMGVLSHLACADANLNDMTHSERQYTLFSKLRAILKERGLTTAKYSLCNSAAVLDGRFADFDCVRPGIILYGCYPANTRFETMMDLKPVLGLKTKMIHLKTLMPQSTVGYGATFTTTRESRIGIIPIGYADGFHRLVSNRGHVLVKGKRAPIVGRVSMDLTAIDVTDIPEAALYDDVTLIGHDGTERITANDIAQWTETICYEVLCGLMARVTRVYEGI